VNDYYTEKLSAERLKRCYEIAPPRVQKYLEEEVNFVLDNIHPGDLVLELGCGYGRIIPALAGKARLVVGIDSSGSSINYASEFLRGISNVLLLREDAARLSFLDYSFNVVVCIQNGISAFNTDQKQLIRESIRVAKPGGIVLFSSYSDKFWDQRLEWFNLQSSAGLIGEIDTARSGNGVIVCKDGFTASTVGDTRFRELTSDFNADISIVEVDESSLFCVMVPR